MLHEYREHQINIRWVFFRFVNIYLNSYRIPNDDNLPHVLCFPKLSTRAVLTYVLFCVGIGWLYMYIY